jgi:hypothetical protein
MCSFVFVCLLYFAYKQTVQNFPFLARTCTQCSAGFTHRPDRLKPRVSRFRGPPAKVYNLFLTLLFDFHTYAVIAYCTF